MNDPIAEQLAYACAALRKKLQESEASSDHWYKETRELQKELEGMRKHSQQWKDDCGEALRQRDAALKERDILQLELTTS